MPELLSHRMNPQKDRQGRINRSKFLLEFHRNETNIQGEQRNQNDLDISDILHQMEHFPKQLEHKIEKTETPKEEKTLEKVKSRIEDIIDKFYQIKQDLNDLHTQNMKEQEELHQNGGSTKRSTKRSTKKRSTKRSTKRFTKKRSTKRRSTFY
jgi:hypothetical protein